MGEKRKLLLRRSKQSTDQPVTTPWPVLVVDDDSHVHDMTRVVLRDFTFQGRGFELISAASAAQAQAILEQRPDIPVMLLDVVMESENSGLVLARHIRQVMGNHRLRIILRTGQPGDAPEREVMEAYDINDYRAKTELTAQKLFTAVAGALRAWQHIDAVEQANATLEWRVAERTQELQDARRFAEYLLEMLPSAVWYRDAEGKCRIANQSFRSLFGPEDNAFSDDFQRHEENCDRRLVHEGAVQSGYEATVAGADGRPRTVVVTKSVLSSETGGLDGILSVATDISERKALESELRRLATTDPLTGIANRRSFMAAATQELERSIRHGHAVSVIMLDVDHFKRINDTYGHACGDEVLVSVTRACATVLRDYDLLGRLGGEEFAVLLPETPLDGATDVAERLRRAVSSTPIPLGSGDIRVTISLGVATGSKTDAAIHHLLARADSALYQAKGQGRDRVIAGDS